MATSKVLTTIRRATQADASILAELGARTIRQTYSAAFSREEIDRYTSEVFNIEWIKADLANPEVVYFLATVNHQVCGYTKLQPSLAPDVITGKHPIELVRLYIDSTWIGQGIGAKLMQAVLEFAINNGFRTCWLRVLKGNDRAIAFEGFRPIHVGSHEGKGSINVTRIKGGVRCA